MSATMLGCFPKSRNWNVTSFDGLICNLVNQVTFQTSKLKPFKWSIRHPVLSGFQTLQTRNLEYETHSSHISFFMLSPS